MSKLSYQDKNMLGVFRRSKKNLEGQYIVSKMVMPFVLRMPVELVDVIPNEDGSGLATLTNDAEVIIDWIL